MCLLVVTPAEKTLPRALFREAWASNPDGASLTWREDGRTRIYRSTKSAEDVYRRYRATKAERGTYVMLHWRWRSSGPTGKAGTHPFYIGDHHLLAHNGHVSDLDRIAEGLGLSDSALLAAILSTQFESADLDSHKGNAATYLERLATRSGSKFAVYSVATGAAWIAGHRYGIERDTVWYSNSSGFPWSSVKPSGALSTARSYPSLADLWDGAADERDCERWIIPASTAPAIARPGWRSVPQERKPVTVSSLANQVAPALAVSCALCKRPLDPPQSDRLCTDCRSKFGALQTRPRLINPTAKLDPEVM